MEVMERGRVAYELPDDAYPDDTYDQVIVLRGVSWDQYVALNDANGEAAIPKFAYLDGELELVVTSDRHEIIKKLGARLVEAYAEETNMQFCGAGNTTFRKKSKKAGLEPDECYWVGKISKYPDLAIEVVYRSGGLNKLEVYRRLGVREVWFWIKDGFRIYHLHKDVYREVARSVVVPGIDLDVIARIVMTTDDMDQTQAVRSYRRSLRRRR